MAGTINGEVICGYASTVFRKSVYANSIPAESRTGTVNEEAISKMNSHVIHGSFRLFLFLFGEFYVGEKEQIARDGFLNLDGISRGEIELMLRISLKPDALTGKGGLDQA